MIFDKTGSLATMTRHDYLPFGEELYANQGLRTTTQGYTAAGYSASDKSRHKFTEQERDDETGLDYMHARTMQIHKAASPVRIQLQAQSGIRNRSTAGALAGIRRHD